MVVARHALVSVISPQAYAFFRRDKPLWLDICLHTRHSGYMSNSATTKITTLAAAFLQPANATHRQYEALRA